MPVQTERFFWNNINQKNLYFKELMKLIFATQDLFIRDLRDTKFAIVAYFIMLTCTLGFLSIKRPLYYNPLLDQVQCYSLRFLFSVSFLCTCRVIFEIQVIEFIFFFPITSYATIKFLDLYERNRRLDLFNKMRYVDTMTTSNIQYSILQILQMVTRQSDQDLNELQSIYDHHKIGCSNYECICNKYERIIITNFKKNVDKHEETLLSSKIINHDLDMKSMIKQTTLANSDLQNNENVDLNSVKIDVTDAISDIQPDNLEQFLENQLNNNYQRHDTQSDKQPPLQMESIYRNQKIDNFTFAFDTNLVIQGLNYEDLFKEVSDIEVLNRKLYIIAESSSTSIQVDAVDIKFNSHREAREYMFIWLMESIFKAYESNQSANNYHRNIEFELLYINFINQYLKKHFLAIFQLLKINAYKNELRFFERLLFAVSEKLILQEAMENFKNYFGGFDYTQFIEGNQQQLELDANYEQTTGDIIEFWGKFKSNDIKIQSILDLGVKISKNINKIKLITRKLEETYAIRKDLGKYQLYALFHLEMLHDPFTFSQMAIYLKNALIFKNKRTIGQIASQGGDSEKQAQQQMMDEKGICIVQAWGGERKQQAFHYGNKSFAEMFNSKELLLPGKSINSIMPKSIDIQHDNFLKRFYNDGHPTILGKMRIQFAKTIDTNYLIPVKIRVNFYYHPKFNYCFFAQFEKIKHMNLFNEEQTKIMTEDCMLFTTDNNMIIQEISENVETFTGLTIDKRNHIEEVNGKKLQLKDFVPDIDKIMVHEFGETCIPDRTDLSLVNKIVNCKQYNILTDQFNENNTFACLLTYTQQVLITSSGETKMNIFLLVPLSKHPDYEGMSAGVSSKYASKGIQNLALKISTNLGDIPPEEKQEEKIFQSLSSDYKNADQLFSISSRSSGSSSGTSNNSIIQAHYTKNLLFQNKAPKVIKINLVLVIGMIAAFFAINIYNLGIFLDKHSKIKDRFNTYSYISQRNANLRATLLNMKMMQAIVKDLAQFNQSTILPPQYSRIDYYYKNLVYNLEIVGQSADQFNQFIMSNKDMYNFELFFDDLNFLTDQGFIYLQSVSYKHAVKLFVSYADSINLNELIKEKPMINVTNYAKNYSDILTNKSTMINRTLTQLEQTLFFVFENGMYKMSQLGSVQINMLTEVSIQQSDEANNTLNVTTFVSIGIVCLIGIIICPLLSKVIERQYVVLRFFNYLDIDKIDEIIKKGSTYHKLLRKKLGIGLDKNRDDDQDQEENDKQSNDKFQNSVSDTSGKKGRKNNNNNDNKQARQNKYKLSANEYPSNSQKDSQEDGKKRKKDKIKQQEISDNDKQNFSTRKKMNDDDKKKGKSTDRGSLRIKSKQRKSQNTFIKNKNQLQLDEDNEDLEEAKNKEENDHENSNKKKKHSKNRNLEIRPMNENDMSKNKQMFAQIQKLSFQKRIKIFCFLVALVLYLNASLLVSFYQSQIVFKNDRDSSIRMNMFYQREECAYNLLLFMREKIIRNYSLPIQIYQSPTEFIIYPAVAYYVEKCYQNEYDIASMRREIPEYLKGSQKDLDGLETTHLCVLTYASQGQDKVDSCNQVMDSILQKGMGNAMYYIIGFIQQMNFNHDSPLSQNPDFLKQLLNQKKMHDLSDFTLYYLKSGFDFLKNLVINTGQQYFDGARTDFLLAFGIFMAVTVLLVIIISTIVYKKAKQAILDIQNMIVLIPLDELDPFYRQKIENYLQA